MIILISIARFINHCSANKKKLFSNKGIQEFVTGQKPAPRFTQF